MSFKEERVVPWLNHTEFFDVFNGLYSQNASEQRRAVDKVEVWRCRAFKKLPVAIDSTATLVESQLKQPLNIKPYSNKSQHENKLSLAVALIRFVNHIVEKGQTKQFAQSVHVLAEEIGLPEWLIDIRHDSTHGCLPSLSLLEEGVLWSLDWLKSEYWEKQTTMDEPTFSHGENPELRHFIANLLMNYSQIQFERNHNSDRGSDNSLKSILTEMENIFPKSKKMVVTVLGQEGYLILTKEQLKTFGVDYNTFMEPNLKLPNIILQFWKPVLKFVHYLKATSMLLEILANKLTDIDSLENRLCAGWVFEIISANKRVSVKETSKASEKNLFSTFYELPVEQILRLCLQKPGGFSSLLVETMSKKEDFSEDFNTAVSMMQIFSGNTSRACDTVTHESVHTLKDLQNEIKSSKRKALKTGKEVNSKHLKAAKTRWSPWKLCTDIISWRQGDCPFGLLHGQDLKSLRLELSSVSQMCKEDSHSETSQDLDSDMSDVQTDMDCSLDYISVKSSGLQSCSVPSFPVINIL